MAAPVAMSMTTLALDALVKEANRRRFQHIEKAENDKGEKFGQKRSGSNKYQYKPEGNDFVPDHAAIVWTIQGDSSELASPDPYQKTGNANDAPGNRVENAGREPCEQIVTDPCEERASRSWHDRRQTTT